MRIGFCFNVLKDDGGGNSTQRDFDYPEVIKAISETIKSLGHEVTEVEADEQIFNKLANLKGKIDLVFNIAEGLYGDARESWVPMCCEILQIPYSHSSPTVHAIKLDKTLTKLAVSGLGVRVPKSVLLSDGKPLRKGEIKFPVIIKPNGEGSSIGVFDANVVENEKQLHKRVAELRSQKLESVLIAEEYVDGREFTVGVLGNGSEAQVLPVIEQRFDILPAEMKPIAGYELKWLVEDTLSDPSQGYYCPAKLNKKQQSQIEEMSKTVYVGLGVRDCARIDYRLDKEGKFYFLEINTLPGLNPDLSVISYFPLAGRAAGMDFKALVGRIILEASKRYDLK